MLAKCSLKEQSPMDSRPSHEDVPQYNAMDKAQAAMRYDYDVVNSFDFSWYVDWKRGL